jgi:hypothetical protein
MMRRSCVGLAVLLCLLTAQEEPVNLTLGALRTAAGGAALDFIVSCVPGSVPVQVKGRQFLFASPDVEFALNGGNGLGHLHAGVVANWVHFTVKTLPSGVVVPDLRAFVHDVPLSLALETTDELDTADVLLEAGYAPWLPTGWRDKVRFGVFAQGGGRVGLLENDTTVPAGGSRAIARARGLLRVGFRVPDTSRFAVGLTGRAEGWYDLLGSKLEYSLRGVLRLFWDRNRSLDLYYQKGTGAPAFDDSGQFGIGVTLQLAG